MATRTAKKRPARKATKRKPPKRPAAKARARKKARPKAPVSPGKKKATGRPPFRPTEDDRKRVESLAGTGALKQDQIALLVLNPTTGEPIDGKTLRRHFRRELETGAIKANAQVGQSLFKKATGSGTQSVTAAIWWEKTRTGMKERVSVEVEDKSGVLVAPAKMSPQDWIAAAAARAVDQVEPGTEDDS